MMGGSPSDFFATLQLQATANTSQESNSSSNIILPPTSLRNFVIDYLAVECYEKSLLRLVQSHPLMQELLDQGPALLSTPPNHGSCSPSTIPSSHTLCKSPHTLLDESYDHASGPMEERMSIDDPVSTKLDASLSGNKSLLNDAQSGLSFYITPFLAYAVKTLRLRKQLTSLIFAGQVTSAKQLCQQYFPDLFQSKVASSMLDLSFQLDTQIFIELVRSNQPKDALLFSHESTLANHLLSKDPQVVKTMTDVFALIAYPSPFHSPLAHLLDVERRKKLAHWTNQQILNLVHPSGTSKLEVLLKQWYLVNECLQTSPSTSTAL